MKENASARRCRPFRHARFRTGWAVFAVAAALLAQTARATDYELAVAGRQVTDANKDDILGDGSGSVRFSGTETTGTLTLSNAAITNRLGDYVPAPHLAGIATDDDFALTIVLEGSNRVKNADFPDSRFIDGIYTKRPLTITGGGSLSLVSDEGLGIVAKGDLTIDGVTVSVEGPSGGGIKCAGNLTITNADVTANSLGVGNGIECQRLSIGGASRLVATTAGTGSVVGKKSALWFKNGIEIGDGLVVSEPSPYRIESRTIHGEGDNGDDGAKRVVIGPPPVPYVERGWDGSAVTESNAVCTDYTVYTDQLTLTNGWYVVKGAFTNADRITVSGEVHLILCDGAVLTATNGIALVGTNNILAVYGQTNGTGRLFAGTDGRTDGNGQYIATCGEYFAGIGGGSGASGGGTVAVYGGTVTAQGGDYAAGIGGGGNGAGGTVTVYGGTVTAWGDGGGAGIGGGGNGAGGTVTVYGGTVTARGNGGGTGIGGGCWAAGGDVAIHGGTVTATATGSDECGAAIGKGCWGASDGGLDIAGMKVTYPPDTLAAERGRENACRERGGTVTLAVCEPHAYDEADDGRCRWCGSQNPVLAVAFDANGGTCGTASREYVRGEPFGSLPEAERPFHDFAGWMTPDGTPVTTNTPATAPFRFLVARWNGRRGVFITTQPESQNVSAGESVTLSVGIRNQAGFRVPLGWGNEVEMLFCPAGTFEMGSPESELGREARYSYRNPDETRHTVVLTHDFWLSRTEITQKQYKDGVMGTNPSAHKEEGRTDLPVDSVSWRDSTNFCLRLTGNEKSAGRLPKGYVFALPTEAEWEYACRAGTTNALASGEELSNTVSCPEMDRVGWYKSNSLSQTHVVGTIWTNAWGFSDMHGNVSEWCWDLYQAAYPTGTVVNPAGPGLPFGGDRARVSRGGSWDSDAGNCRSAARGYDQPSHGGALQGFRLALVRSRDLSVPLSDDLRLELTAVNPDTFQMGSPDGELGRNTDETRHAVTLTQVYWIGKHEVSQAQWLEVMGSYPEAFPAEGSPAFHGVGEDLPVYATSHAEAVEFCELLTERERAAGRLPAGYRFALPTEAQWEYACRGGTTKALNNDHDLLAATGENTSLDQVAWYLANAGERVHSIHDEKKANSPGEYGGVFQPHSCMEGMHGNVREWVADWYGVYPAEAVTDPAGPATGTERILRGGGIDDEPADCRSAARIRSPGGAATGTSGLRVALVPVAGVPGNPDALYPPPEPWDRTSRGESYQWFRDGTPIEGATGASLSIPYAKSSDAGRYTVAVTAGGMSATSAVAVLRVRMESEVVGGVTWYYVTNAAGGATVTEVDPPAGDLAMPETLGGLAVTEVGGGAFENCTNLTGMAIASGVTNIGAAAFQGCSALAKVWVPIEKKGTDLLANTELPDTCEIHYYGEQVVTFLGNGGTPETATNDYAIGEKYGTLPTPAWRLHTFRGWQAETNGAAVTATDTVTEDAERTLVAQWTNGVVVSNVLWTCQTNESGGVTVTGVEPAEGDLVMPGELDGFPVTAVWYEAFMGCTNLTGMAIPDGVMDIGQYAFQNCTALTNLVIPDSVTEIDIHAFDGCSGLTNLVIGAGVTFIDSGAFYKCSALTDVTIPDAVATIEDHAFQDCASLTNVWLGTGVETIEVDAFAGCTNLATIWLPIERKGSDLLDNAGVPDGCTVRYYGTQTVTFDANGGTCATATNAVAFGPGATYGELPDATRADRDFLGWFDAANGGTQVTAATTVPEETARTLYAHWGERAVKYQVAFAANGGKGKMAKQTMTVGKAAKLRKNAFQRKGLVFAGWGKTAKGNVAYRDQQAVKNLRTTAGTVTLHAKWAKPKYKVAFDANGGRLPKGSCMDPQTMKYGKAARLRPCRFVRSGYFFIGWAKTKDGPVVFQNQQAVKNLRRDGKTTRLYAKWARKVFYVAYDANGGKGKMGTQKFIWNVADKLHANAFTREGYAFDGWAKTKTGKVAYSDRAMGNHLTVKGGTVTLYAKWKKVAARKASTAAARGPKDGAKPREASSAAAPAAEKPVCIAVTASGGGDAAAVADGDETTSWTPGTAAGSWVVLTLASPCTVEDVEVVGDNLPDGTRFLLSEDADDWKEGVPGRALYVWVAFPAGDAAPVVREIRLAAP